MAGRETHHRLLAGRYRLLEQPKSGGTGPLWWGRDELLGRPVAVKEVYVPPGLTDDERSLLTQRTLRKARLAARLRHPNVVAILAAVEHDGRPWIVTEWLPCQSVAYVLSAHGPLRPGQAAETGLSVTRALAAAHWAGVLHGAVEPSNVLLVDDGSVVLTGFGIGTTESGYLTPERARGRPAGPASDRWLLGATLYTAVEGRPPYQRPHDAALRVAVTTEDPDPPLFAGALWPVLQGLLRPEPAERLSATDIESLLAEVAAATVEPAALPARPPRLPVRRPGHAEGGGPERARPLSPRVDDPAGAPVDGAGAAGGARRRRATVAAALVLALTAGTVVGWSTWPGDDDRRPGGVVAEGERPEPPWHWTPPGPLPPGVPGDTGDEQTAAGDDGADAGPGGDAGDGGGSDGGGSDGGGSDGGGSDDDGGDDGGGGDGGGGRDDPGRGLGGQGAVSSPDALAALGAGRGRGQAYGGRNRTGATRWSTDGDWGGAAVGRGPRPHGARPGNAGAPGGAARTHSGRRGNGGAPGVSDASLSSAYGHWRAAGSLGADGRWSAGGHWDARGSGLRQRAGDHHGAWKVRGDRSGIHHLQLRVTDSRLD